jgi:hypothetical protein
MELLLRDDYFDAKNLTEHFVDSQNKMVDAIRKHTVELRNTNKQVIAKISGSTSVTLSAIFEATEVQTPTCFVILPKELSFSLSDTGDSTEAMALKSDYIEDIIDKAIDCIYSPFKFAAAFVKSPCIESTMFLYLVDESTGEPVGAQGYPLKINVLSEQAEKFLPLMALGMQILASTNNALGMISMFYPGIPRGLIPKFLLAKANRFLEESNKSGITSQVVRQGSTDSETVRGNDLRAFAAFLKDRDPACTFSGLRRICDKSSGKAMWVTKESATNITDENEVANDNDEEDIIVRAGIPNADEVKRLRIENQEQAGEISKQAGEISKQAGEISKQAGEISRLTAALGAEKENRSRVENQLQAAEICCAIS